MQNTDQNHNRKNKSSIIWALFLFILLGGIFLLDGILNGSVVGYLGTMTVGVFAVDYVRTIFLERGNRHGDTNEKK